jgi:HK97 family phage prohead protease
MPDDILTTEALDDAVEVRSEEERIITLRLVPFGVVANTRDGREVFMPGAFDGVDPSSVTIESQKHGGPLVGVGESIEQRDDAAYLDARIARTRDGDDLLELARSKVLRKASIVFVPTPAGSRRRDDGVIERHRVELRRVAVLERGAYAGAQVVAVRSAAEEEPVVTDTLDTAITLEQMRSAVREIVMEAIPAPVITPPAPTDEPSPLARADSLAALAELVIGGETGLNREMARAWADGVIADVPSIARPAWLSTIYSIMNPGRPVVTAFGREALPDTGMEVDWPTFDGDLEDRVAVQSAEKAVIISKKVVLASDKATVKTYAGGLDASWQVLRRTSPKYREIVYRILAAAWASVTDAAFGADLVSKGTGTFTLDVTTAEKLHASLVEASAKVDDATGAPASFVLAAADKWLEIAKVAALMPPAYGTQNIYGTSQASTLRVEVSGLPVLRAKGLADGTVIVSNGQAASWLEDGFFTAEQDQVAKLGTDIAIWSLGASGIFIPTGVVKAATAAP